MQIIQQEINKDVKKILEGNQQGLREHFHRAFGDVPNNMLSRLLEMVDEGAYEDIINVMGGMQFLDNFNDGGWQDKLGEALSAGICARNGFEVHKKD